MEVKLKELQTDPRVTMFLLPLPLPKSAAKESKKASSSLLGSSPVLSVRPLKKAKPSAKAKLLRAEGFSSA